MAKRYGERVPEVTVRLANLWEGDQGRRKGKRPWRRREGGQGVRMWIKER